MLLLSCCLTETPGNFKRTFERVETWYFVTKIVMTYFENKLKRGSLLGNEQPHLGGDSPIFEILYSNLEQRSIFS